ncbi:MULTISPECIES: GAF domain-containing protein [unclassified Blastococcus]
MTRGAAPRLGSARTAPDPVAHARTLSRVFDAVLAGDPDAPRPRPVVSASWERSLAAHVDPEHRTPPVVYAEDELRDIRDAHPLNAVLPLLQSTLTSIADEAVHVMLVTDAAGNVLWREGAATLLHQGDRVGLFPGTNWSEQAIGTNAMGTTLAVDEPVQIHSAEHLVRTYHSWTCVAAPVHDPETGSILGAIDLSGPLQTVHPALVQLVSTTAQLAEHQLRVRSAIADERLRRQNMRHLTALRGAPGALLTPSGRLLAGQPWGWWPDRMEIPAAGDRLVLPGGQEVVVEQLDEGLLLRTTDRLSGTAAGPPERALSLRLMGDEPPRAVVRGRPIPLTLRPAEMLTALVLHPEGLTGEQLALLLYGDEGNPTTVRVEVLRLRSLIGAELLLTRPYRLTTPVDSDLGTVRRALQQGQAATALRGAPGPLLPRSEAPLVRQLRGELSAAVRRAVLDSGDVDLLHELAHHRLGEDDLEVHDRLIELLPVRDPRLAPLTVRRGRLAAD